YSEFVSRVVEDRRCGGMGAVVTRAPSGACPDLRLVAGAVSEIPLECAGAGAMARGKHLSDSLIQEIAESFASSVDPLSDLRGSAWYRKQIIRVMARRAMQQASGAAQFN